VQATVPNQAGRLQPGLFAEVELVLPRKKQVLIVPATAVLNSTSGNSVFVVTPAEEGSGLVAQQRLVRTGETRGDFITVESGLKAGERVVRAGAFKLHNGSSVVESDVGVPEASLQPKPKNS